MAIQGKRKIGLRELLYVALVYLVGLAVSTYAGDGNSTLGTIGYLLILLSSIAAVVIMFLMLKNQSKDGNSKTS